MKIVKGQTALITGASMGIGVYIAKALAEMGMNMVLAARSSENLELIRQDIESMGVRAIAVPTDVSDHGALKRLVKQANDVFGRIDVLVNNAGIETIADYDVLTQTEIDQVIQVNLIAPMALTRLVFPDMLRRNSGHVVNISSVAGILPTAFNESYAASKYGLVGFTRSLRLTSQEKSSSVSASVICPGFIDDAGMYEDMKRNYRVKAPWFIGSLPAHKVADAVKKSIERDLPNIIVMRGFPRLIMCLSIIVPRILERIAVRHGFFRVFRNVAQQRGTQRNT